MGREMKNMDHKMYIRERKKVVKAFDRFDKQLVGSEEKKAYRQALFAYLMNIYGNWSERGDCLPSSYYDGEEWVPLLQKKLKTVSEERKC